MSHRVTSDYAPAWLSQADMFAAQHEIRRFDVLLAGAGTLGENELYGYALIADGRLISKYVGPDSMTLVFKEPGSEFSLFCIGPNLHRKA